MKAIRELKGWFGKAIDKTDDNSKNEYFKLLYPNNSTPTGWNFGEQANREKFAGYMTNPQKANGTVYSIVNSLASTAAELFGFVELLDNNDKVIPEHPALIRLHNPNDLDTMTTFIERMMYNLLITGDVFVYGEWREGADSRDSMYVIPSASVGIVSGGLNQPIKGYNLKGSIVGNKPKLTPDNTLFICLPNIDGETLYGLSPLSSVLKDLETLDTAKRLERKLIDQGGVKNLICLDQFPEGENVRAFMDAIEDQMNDKNAKSNQVYMIPLRRIPMGDTSADLSLEGIIKSKTEAVCHAYSYPPNLLYSESTYSNLREAKKQKYAITIPYVNLLAEALGKFFGLDKMDMKLQLNTDQIEELKPDYTAVVNAMRDYATINEVREYMKLPPIDGGDILLVNLGKMPLNDVVNGIGGEEEPGPGGGNNSDENRRTGRQILQNE